MVALVIDKDLRLVLQPAKRARMDDAVAVALKRRAHRVLGLGMEPAATFFGIGRIGRSRNRPNHGRTLRRPEAGVYREVSAALGQAVVCQCFLICPRAAAMCSGCAEACSISHSQGSPSDA